MDSSSSFVALCGMYRQATAIRNPVCASFNDPRAVSNRARALPPCSRNPPRDSKPRNLERAAAVRRGPGPCAAQHPRAAEPARRLQVSVPKWTSFSDCACPFGAACVTTDSHQLSSFEVRWRGRCAIGKHNPKSGDWDPLTPSARNC